MGTTLDIQRKFLERSEETLIVTMESTTEESQEEYIPSIFTCLFYS